ncbi:GntR family transcriptional regulator [Mariniplasma anaerobium]|uniref:GntR family transcriptional regulator n=1 Tax=Mariniplasma anaerobium TaxID=2735436 RepID=A0A7U9XW14_9MOLU|nr:GntR family transcriptional regulator [Mariniplasma anaerobium]BCR35886.1 GntR family transcriptional regulator [Mariniplasma anaerobium]
MKTDEKNIARYEQIAYQLAKDIVSGNIKELEKLSGRSLLSSKYNVSSETIRKAIELLHAYHVVKVKDRSGIIVISSENASAYIRDYKKKNSSKKHFEETLDLLEQSTKMNQDLHKKIKKIMQLTKSELFPFEYFVIKLNEQSNHIGETIASINLYDKAETMIVAYEKEKLFYQAPSPDTCLSASMKLYILGNDEIERKVKKFFNS